MTLAECLILFWLLPALVTSLGVFQIFRVEEYKSPSELTQSDWLFFVLGVVIYPIVWVGVVCTYLLPTLLEALLKERKLGGVANNGVLIEEQPLRNLMCNWRWPHQD